MVEVKKQPSWFKVLASGVWRWQFLLVGFRDGFLGFRFSVRILHMTRGHGHGCLDFWTSFLSQLMSGLNSHTLSLSLSLFQMVAEKLKLLCKAKSAMAVYLDYQQAQNKTVLLPHESTRKKPSKYTNRDLKHEKGDELERERGSVCVCVWEREREGGETSTHHSVTKLGGISELMDGERKPNVKFCTADVTSTIVPIISSNRMTRAVQWRCMSESSLAIFFTCRFSLPKLRRRIHWCEENFNSQLADRRKLAARDCATQTAIARARKRRERRDKREWVHTKEEDWAARGQDLPELKKNDGKNPTLA